jgi:hypothetical protein
MSGTQKLGNERRSCFSPHVFHDSRRVITISTDKKSPQQKISIR